MAGKATYRIVLRADKEMMDRIDIIRSYEKKKRGNDQITNAIRASIFYYSQDIIDNKI